MPTITLAEALAQFDLIRRRAEHKRRFIESSLLREGRYRDPLAREGGTAAVLGQEWRSLDALLERQVLLRRLIQAANEQATLTIGDVTRSVADWLVWKREVPARRKGFLDRLRRRIAAARRAALSAAGPREVVVHLDEKALAEEAEKLEQTLGQLAGQVALKNATVTVEVPPDETWMTGREARLEEAVLRGAAPAAAQPPPGRPWSDSPELCRLARDPAQKIAAIKLYRELTGAGLMHAKQAVEEFAASPVPVLLRPDLEFPWSESEELRALAGDPAKKIQAIVKYRQLTGVSLPEAKQAVEAFAQRRR